MMCFISPARHQLMSQSPDLPLGGQLRILRQSSTSGLLDTMARQLKKSPGWMVFCRKNWMVFCHFYATGIQGESPFPIVLGPF